MKKFSDTRRMMASHHGRRRAITERFEARLAGIAARIDSGEIANPSLSGALNAAPTCGAPNARGGPSSSALGVALSGGRP